MLRAVRLAATLGFDDRAGDARGDPRACAPLVAPPLRRADRDGARADPRRGAAVGRAAAPGRHRPARGDLCRSSRRSAACPRTRSRARTSGTTRSRTVDAAVAHPVVRLAALAPRHRQAGDRGRRPLLRPRDRRRRAGRRAPRPAPRAARGRRERVAHLVRQHMFRYEPSWSDAAVRRFIGKVGPGRDRRAVRAARGGQRRQRRAARRRRLAELRARVEAELRGRAGARPVGARDRRRRPDRRAGARRRDRASGGSSTRCSSGSSTTRPSTSAPTLLLLARDLAADDR